MTTLRGGASLGAGLAVTGLSPCAFWGRYFALGGIHTRIELLAYLDGDTAWTLFEHDVAVLALNEYCDTLGLGYPVAYAQEL